jgi:hypothetical protein
VGVIRLLFVVPTAALQVDTGFMGSLIHVHAERTTVQDGQVTTKTGSAGSNCSTGTLTQGAVALSTAAAKWTFNKNHRQAPLTHCLYDPSVPDTSTQDVRTARGIRDKGIFTPLDP